MNHDNDDDTDGGSDGHDYSATMSFGGPIRAIPRASGLLGRAKRAVRLAVRVAIGATMGAGAGIVFASRPGLAKIVLHPCGCANLSLFWPGPGEIGDDDDGIEDDSGEAKMADDILQRVGILPPLPPFPPGEGIPGAPQQEPPLPGQSPFAVPPPVAEA